MNDTQRTIGYFMSWGTYYGLVLGAWSTGMMSFGFGAVFGIPWGLGIGATCGLVSGLLVAAIQAFTFHPDVDLTGYSRRLSLVVGAVVGIMAPLLLITTSRGILWRDYTTSGAEFFIPCVIASIFWGSLSAAYTAYNYPFWIASLMMGQKEIFPYKWSYDSTLMSLIRTSANRMTIVIGAALGLAWNVGPYLLDREIYRSREGNLIAGVIEGILEGIVITPILMGIFALAIAGLITFLGRLLFSEDTLSQAQRTFLTAMSTIFTGLVLSVPVTTFGGDAWIGYLPVCGAILTAFYVYRALPLLDAGEKAKRKEAASLATE
jgi:hypothetical protein